MPKAYYSSKAQTTGQASWIEGIKELQKVSEYVILIVFLLVECSQPQNSKGNRKISSILTTPENCFKRMKSFFTVYFNKYYWVEHLRDHIKMCLYLTSSHIKNHRVRKSDGRCRTMGSYRKVSCIIRTAAQADVAG